MAGKITRATLAHPPKAAAVPFAYRAGNTFLHRIPAIVKLLCVIALSIAAFAAVYGLAASILLLVIFSVIARIHPWSLLKGSKLLVLLSLVIILLKLDIPNTGLHNVLDGITVALRILVTYTAAALLFAVTTMRELRLSLAVFERKNSMPFFSLGLSLMLGFIPRFFELWEVANLACEARSCKRGLRRVIMLIPLVTDRMIGAASDTALALEARGIFSKVSR